jgi:HEAT repeat protein
MKTNLFSPLLVAGLLALLMPSARADQEQDLISILKSDVAWTQKCDACQKLRIIGSVKSVPALATLLVEERVSHAARYALEGMPFPEAGAALREALSKTSGPVKAGIIDSLGWRRDATAVSSLTKALSDGDPTVAAAAAGALGRLGGKEAIAALSAARTEAPPAAQPAVLDGLLRCADQLLDTGDAKGAALLYRTLLNPKPVDPIGVAAWRGLVIADRGERAELVTKALGSREEPHHIAALKLLRELNDADVLEACIRQWATMPADSQLAVLDARLKLGGDVLPLVNRASQNPDLTVRVAAWQALANCGAPASVLALSRAAASGEPAERDAARDTLARVRGPGVREAMVKQLASAETQEKVELLRAFGERGDSDAAQVLLDAAAEVPAVRLAALEALGKIASQDTAAPLLGLAARSKSESECEPVLGALYAVCRSSPNKEQATAVLLASMKPLSPAERRLVLPVLSELGTHAAMDAALAATREQDIELRKQAVRVLAQWPNPAPAASLLQLATNTDPVLQVLAVRGCIDLAGLEPDYSKRLALLQNVLSQCSRSDEKRQALSQLGQVPTPDALHTALGYLGESEVADEAGLAALMIAEKLAGSDPKLAAETADKVLARCNTADIVKRAWAIRVKPAGEGPYIQDWLVSGPYSKPGAIGAQALFDLSFAPEERNARAEWKPLPRAKIADLSAFFPGQMNCVAYLKTRVISPQDSKGALLLGSDDGVKAWLNGVVVHGNNVDRGLIIDQDMAPIELKQGPNELLLKITQGGGGWAACARIIGLDGKSIKGLTFQVER